MRINAAPTADASGGPASGKKAPIARLSDQVLRWAWNLTWFTAPWFGIAASIQLMGIDLVLAFITPDYDAAGETISQMQGVNAAYADEARLSLLVYCLLIIPFVLLVTRLPDLRQPWVKVMTFGFWVHLVMGFLTVGFQSEYHRVVFLGFTDNNLHDAAGHVFFVAGILGVVGTVIAMHRVDSYRNLKIAAAIAASIMILTGLMFVTRTLNDYLGIHERIGFAAYLTWLALMSIRIGMVRPEGRRETRATRGDRAVSS